MAFGCQWDSKTRRYAAQTTSQRFPAWMYNLGKELASDAHNYTHVYSHGSDFAPDVALVNFYPVSYILSILSTNACYGYYCLLANCSKILQSSA